MVRVGGLYYVWILITVFDLLVKKKVDVGLLLRFLCVLYYGIYYFLKFNQNFKFGNKQLVYVYFIKLNYLTFIDQFLFDFKFYLYSFIYYIYV